eukprot:10641406-Karenia_brevis.AAC.1
MLFEDDVEQLPGEDLHLDAAEDPAVPELQHRDKVVFSPELTEEMLQNAERPLALVFSRFPLLSHCSAYGSSIDSWRADPLSALRFAQEAERLDWLGLLARPSPPSDSVPFVESVIGRSLAAGSKSF